MQFTTRYLYCLVLSCSLIIGSQAISSDQEASDLCAQADSAFTEEDYERAIDLWLDAISHVDTEEWKKSLLYAVGKGYAQLDDAEHAFQYLDSAVTVGFTDYRKIANDPLLESLRNNHEKRFTATLERVKAAKQNEIERLTPIDVIEYDNYDGPLGIDAYEWGDLNRPEFDTLRNTYRLHKIVEAGETEFEKMKQMLNWVSTRWVHDGSKMAPDRNALAILREVDNGKRFCCANYADVLIDCMRALGYPTRFVGLRTDDAAYTSGGGHGCLEVWSNQYQKWILIDGQNNAWWEHDGIPLSAFECHRLFIDGNEDELKFVGQHVDVDYSKNKSIWAAYFHRVLSYWMGANYELIYNDVLPDLLYQKRPQNNKITDAYETVYPRLNRTRITLEFVHVNILDSLNIILNHTMPYFDRFLVRFDEGEWQETQDSFPWVFHEGVNSVEAKAVNSMGIEGKPSRIVINNNLAALGMSH